MAAISRVIGVFVFNFLKFSSRLFGYWAGFPKFNKKFLRLIQLHSLKMTLLYLFSWLYVLRNLIPILVQGEELTYVIRYTRLGNSLCTLSFITVQIVAIVVLQLKMESTLKFSTELLNVDGTFLILKQKANDDVRFWMYSSILLMNTFFQSMIVCYTYLGIFKTLGDAKIEFLTIAIYTSNSNSIMSLMYLIVAYILEILVKFKLLNVCFDR